MTKYSVFGLSLPLLLCHALASAKTTPTVAPLPAEFSASAAAEGLAIDDLTQFVCEPDDPAWRAHERVLRETWAHLHGKKFAEGSMGKAVTGDAAAGKSVRLLYAPDLAAERHQLKITSAGVEIRASDPAGLAHATATLLQLAATSRDGKLEAITIDDHPSTPFRAFMVDLGRNPHSLDTLKKCVDWLWLYKVRYLQLHLTDDQRFAFPSTAFPQLNEDTPDFTANELRELEAYAAARGVTIIPELEAPGHSAILREKYPDVFGRTPTDLATLPAAHIGLKKLIDEMLSIFQSTPYVHIGGDEAFGVPAHHQRDLINLLNKHIKSHGKQTIVWEGPGLGVGDNKVATDVLHVNWRTINFPADEMLAAGYPVVNAAWDPLYIVDHYPRNNFTMAAPRRIYDHLKLRRFAHYNPGIATFAEPIETQPQGQVIGFCMPWWEGREEFFATLCLPRIGPMAAVAWNSAVENDYADFCRRDLAARRVLDRISTPVAITTKPREIDSTGVFAESTRVALSSHLRGAIHYTLDGSMPDAQSTRYTKPFVLDRSAWLRAALIADGARVGHVSEQRLTKVTPRPNLALGKPVTSSAPSGPFFSVSRLTDGGLGNLDYYLGYPTVPEPIELIVDLESLVQINRIDVISYASGESYEDFDVAHSRDGVTYETVGNSPRRAGKNGVSTFPFEPTHARYLRVTTSGHKGQVFESFSRIVEIEAYLWTGETTPSSLPNEE